MKKAILIFGLLTTNFVFAQNEQPAELDTKDLLEVNKPEFEDNDLDINLDEFVPKMEMPVLVPQFEPAEETVSKPKQTKEVPTKTTVVNEKKPAETKIENATTALTIQQLKKNDLVRIEFSQIKIYRRVKGKIIKYKFRNSLDLNSSGLNKKDDTTYYVVDTETIISDTQKAKEAKETVAQTTDSNQTVVLESNSDTDDAEIIAKLRNDVEKRLNNGKSINSELLVKNLRTNDMIYIIGDILLVTRKNKATSGTKKYWLTEDIDVDNPSLEKESNNRYKVLRKYQ